MPLDCMTLISLLLIVGCAHSPPPISTPVAAAVPASQPSAEPLSFEQCLAIFLNDEAPAIDKIRAARAARALPTAEGSVLFWIELAQADPAVIEELTVAYKMLGLESDWQARLQGLIRKDRALNELARQWPISLGGWRSAPRLADMIDSPDPRMRQLSASIVADWLQDPAQGMRRILPAVIALLILNGLYRLWWIVWLKRPSPW